MHPALVVTMGMAGVALVRWCVREVSRITSEFDAIHAQAAVDPVDRRSLPTLRRDPRTGEYRPG